MDDKRTFMVEVRAHLGVVAKDEDEAITKALKMIDEEYENGGRYPFNVDVEERKGL